MIRHLLVSSILCLAMISPAAGQNWDFHGGITYGSYSMQNLKDYLNSISIPDLDLERGAFFPPTSGWEAGSTCVTSKFSLGFYLGSNSTKGHLFYADKSDRLDMEVLAGSFVLAFDVQKRFVKKPGWEMYLTLREGLSFNSVKLKSSLQIGTELTTSTRMLQSSNFFLAPGIGGRIFYRKMFVQPSVHYSLDVARGSLKLNGLDVDHLGQPMRAGWSGLRLAFTVGYRVDGI